MADDLEQGLEQKLEQKVGDYIKSMPSLPITVTKVLAVCDNIQTSPADLNHVISLDPVLVGRVLKLINSAYYGAGQHVTNMVRAIIMLGINTVKNLALSTAVLGTLPSRKFSQGLNMDGFWRHSLCVGVAAKIIAKKRNIDSKHIEEYFTAGLLHDIGKVPLSGILSNKYMAVISDSDRDQISLIRAEDRTLGINHCGAGDMILTSWKLEGAVRDVVLYHHNSVDYKGPYKDILYSVILANRFASIMEIGFAGDRYPEKPYPAIWNYLGLGTAIFDELESTVNEEIQKAEIFLRL
ncbi:HD family phosphohydrolase [Spirochaetia bacterium]|nr:HD family phosphohydrolase [Spirochaetia bacterium]